jgi:hypothetical protein
MKENTLGRGVVLVLGCWVRRMCMCCGGVFFLFVGKGTPPVLKNPSEETWVTDETSSRRKSTPGDASMRRSIQDLAISIDPNIKIEPEVEDVRPRSSSHLILPPPFLVTHASIPFYGHCIASFRYRRRVYRLGHQFWVPPR